MISQIRTVFVTFYDLHHLCWFYYLLICLHSELSVHNTSPIRCEGNDDCDSNLCGNSLGNPICIDCSINSDCLPPLTCINGVCQNPSRIGGACDLYDDADCRDGYCFSLKCHDPTAFTAAESALILLRATSDASELTASTWKSIGSISDTLTNSLGFTSFPSINTIVRNRIEVVFDGTSYMRGSTPLSSLNGNSPFTVEAIIANTDANEGRYRDVEAVVVFGRPQSHGQSFYACVSNSVFWDSSGNSRFNTCVVSSYTSLVFHRQRED